MAETLTDDLLEFTTKREERHITIDRRAYPLRRMLDLPLDKHLFVERTMPEIGRLSVAVALEKASDGDKAKLSTYLQKVVAIAVEAPPKVLDKLADSQRLQVCRVFLELPLPRLGRAEAKTRRASRSTGAKSSRT